MRHKVYTREHILKAAYELIEKDGFSNFTARNVANQMGVSTQPIYLEFDNMEDLKQTLIKEIFDDLTKKVFSVEHTGDKVIDISINYIDFAQKNPRLFMAMYLDEKGGGKAMYDLSYRFIKDTLLQEKEYQNLSEEYIEALFHGTWITITGLATLMLSKVIVPSRQQTITIIENSVNAILESNYEDINLSGGKK
ncbi:TetR family transcriptional regulator [Tetragenococcus halophilus subsp. flandriensis]|uniref:TetR/AcrR family transcriptional regulator n=1 Tax=Tetragenococcus halophilus TaxID=51669 RepID=UPI0023E990A7|nr:TetR/AcrR family transcriptional regulator [Tetragenococcus halophilus]GMA06972.1 TetR family transcriptional regulator [Tetragenococcus halophilus subsp. flandriensis]